MKSPTYAEQCAATCQEPACEHWVALPIKTKGKVMYYGICGPRGRITDVPLAVPNYSPIEQEAHVRLISAAPELLEALKRAANHLIMTGTRNADAPEAIAQARAAIAKAQGTP